MKPAPSPVESYSVIFYTSTESLQQATDPGWHPKPRTCNQGRASHARLVVSPQHSCVITAVAHIDFNTCFLWFRRSISASVSVMNDSCQWLSCTLHSQGRKLDMPWFTYMRSHSHTRPGLIPGSFWAAKVTRITLRLSLRGTKPGKLTSLFYVPFKFLRRPSQLCCWDLIGMHEVELLRLELMLKTKLINTFFLFYAWLRIFIMWAFWNNFLLAVSDMTTNQWNTHRLWY